jgi:hypothetical protein
MLTANAGPSDTTNVDFEIEMMPADGIAAALAHR